MLLLSNPLPPFHVRERFFHVNRGNSNEGLCHFNGVKSKIITKVFIFLRMQKSKLLWIISLFFPLIALCGCGKSAHHDDLAIVDSALKSSSESQARAMALADSLSRRGLYESDPEKLLEIWLESAKTYQSLDLQKSLEYLYKAGEEARKTEN